VTHGPLPTLRLRPAAALILALSAALTLASCGRKPESLVAPQGAENDQFPAFYPPEPTP